MKRVVMLAAIMASAMALAVYANCGSCAGDSKPTCGLGEGCAKPEKVECSGKVCAVNEAECKVAVNKTVEATIGTDTLRILIGSGVQLTVIDARTGKYDDGKRIPGAIGLGADSDVEAIGRALPSKDALIVTYCSNTKCPASGMLAKKLQELGYKHILEYPEGIAGWIEAGNAVTEEKK